MYNEFMRSIDEAMNNEDKMCSSIKTKFSNKYEGTTFNQKFLDQSYAEFATVSVKTYQRGLSKMFFDKEANQNGHYLVKGPVGKGLGITKESEGVHVAFTAGTGILVFIDLVTRIYLSRIEAIPEEERLSPLFKFVLYASFANKQDACGVELCEKVNNFMLKYGFNNFELYSRYSKKNRAGKLERWNEKFIKKQLVKFQFEDLHSRFGWK